MSVLYIRDKDGNLIPVHTIKGKDGKTPEKGVDYYTAADKAELKAEFTAHDPVNVMDYGAVGDGTTDDTAAFQAALNTGKDVYIPHIPGKNYRITDTLHIKKVYQSIHGENGRGSKKPKATSGSTIYFDTDEERKVLFSIEQHDIYFSDICIIGKDRGDSIGYGIAFQCLNRPGTDSAIDQDIEFVNVRVSLVETAIDFEGRGVKVMNCLFASLKNVFVGRWDEDLETNDEGDRCPGTGQRGYVFQNNRFHSIRQRFIKIDSGHAYGLVFENNVIDHGKGLVFEVAEEAWNWIVNGNVMQAMILSKKDNEATEKLATCTFHGGAKNCIFANNVLSSKNNYHISAVGVIPYYYMKFATLADSVIHGNSFDNCSRDAIVVSGAISNSVVSGNVFTNIGGEEVSFGNSADFEWENPPMELGVEYRTTKRHLGKVVYTLAYTWGSLPNATSDYKTFSDTDVKPISVKLILDDGYVASTGYNIDRNQSTTKGFYVGNTTKSITVVTEGDFSKRSAIGVVEYTKS